MKKQYILKREISLSEARVIDPGAKCLRGHTIFANPRPEADLPAGGYWRLEVCENGGGMTNTGHATCWAGTTGDKLVPVFVPRGYAGGEHAFFSGGAFLRAQVSRQRSERSGTLTLIQIDPKSGEITEDLLWEGETSGDPLASFLPEGLAYAAGLVDRAAAKAYCYHCREPHFAELREQTRQKARAS